MSDLEFDDNHAGLTGPGEPPKPWERETFQVKPSGSPELDKLCGEQAGSERWEIGQANRRFARGAQAQYTREEKATYLHLRAEIDRLHTGFEVFDQEFKGYQPNSPECEAARAQLNLLRQSLSHVVLKDGKVELSAEILHGHNSPCLHSTRLEHLASEACRTNHHIYDDVCEMVKIIAKHDKIVAPPPNTFDF